MQKEISENFQKYADAKLVENHWHFEHEFYNMPKQLKSADIVLEIDKNEFLVMADIIDEKIF